MSVVPKTPISGILAEDVDWDGFRTSMEGSCRIISRYRTLTSASADVEQNQLVYSITTCSQEYIRAVGESIKVAEHTNIICSDVLQFFDIKKHHAPDDEVKFSKAVEASADTAYGNAGLVHGGFRSVRRQLVEVHEQISAWRRTPAGNAAAVCAAEKQTLTLDALAKDIEEALRHSEKLEANVDALVSWWQRVKSLAQALRSGPAKNAQVSKEIRQLMDRKKWEQLRNASGYYVDQVHKFSDAHNLGFEQIPSVLPTPTDERNIRVRLPSIRQVMDSLRVRTRSGVNGSPVEVALQKKRAHEGGSRRSSASLIHSLSGSSGPSRQLSTSDNNLSPITSTTTVTWPSAQETRQRTSKPSVVSDPIAVTEDDPACGVTPIGISRAAETQEAVAPEVTSANTNSSSEYCGCCVIM